MKKLALTIAISGVTALFAYINYDEKKPLRLVLEDRADLICNNIPIDKSKIVDFDGNRWYFTNGSMTNCEVVV